MAPLLLMFLSVLIFSQAANVVKLSTAPSLIMVFWRTLEASFFLILIYGLLLWKNKQLHYRKIILPRASILPVFLSGLTLFIHFFFWFAGIKRTTVGNTATIFAINPLFTTIGAFVIFKDSIPKRFFGALFLGLLGIIIVFYEKLQFGKDQALGDFLVFISAILFSAYILLSKWARRKMNNLHFTFWLNLISAGCALITIFFLQPNDPSLSFFTHDSSSWLSFTLMAILSSILGHALFTYCLQFINVSLMSFTLLLSPIMAIIGAYFFYGEIPPPRTLQGLFLVLLGMGYLHYPGIRKTLRRQK